jgi:DNA-binding IclR family transcriptional regulator
VKSVVKMFDIIRFIQENGGARPTEVAAELGVAKSTAHRHLSTLYDEEFLDKVDDRYVLGLRFLDLGQDARNRNETYRMVKPKVTELALETEERAQFIVEEHGRGVYVYRDTGTHGVQTDPGIGKRIALHSISAGKAILANMPEEKVDEIIERWGLEARTPHTTTDRDELFAEFETIRERGYSINNQENILGQRAIGVAIEGAHGETIGALSVSGPLHRMQQEFVEEEISGMLLGVVNELELNIRHAGGNGSP